MSAVFPVIMCGGSGVRLWPASKPTHPKQFVPLTGPRSSFQETVLRVVGLQRAVRPLIVAGVRHRDLILKQLSDIGVAANLLLEPEARDSAAAMAAAALWIDAREKDGVAVIVSADHDIPNAAAFRAAMNAAVLAARDGRIVTLGVRPTHPSSAYGYIRPGVGAGEAKPVEAFVEKPDTRKAAEYLAAGYLWNSGNFVAPAKVLIAEFSAHAPQVLEAVRQALGVGGADDVTVLGGPFHTAPKISLDYAIMEKTERASVLPVEFAWSDLGAWDAVLDASPRDREGNATSGDVLLLDAEHTLVRAGPGVRIAAVGVSNLAIVAEGAEVLVCDLARSQSVKAAVEVLKGRGAPRAKFATLPEAAAWYDHWLRTCALPLWATLGTDYENGGFVEALGLDGKPVPADRRGRVQGRQIYVFASAGEIGWSGPWRQVVQHGLDFVGRYFLRSDGMLRTLVGSDGRALDETVAIYDQAFALLGFAAAYATGVRREEVAASAASILSAMEGRRHEAGGFRESGSHPFQSNCHMHLLEAALAWAELGDDRFAKLSDELGKLALASFIDPREGLVREFFEADWSPALGEDGRRVEPGHQFEWAWLLTRWAKIRGRPEGWLAAQRLYRWGRNGIDARGVACDALLDDLSELETSARLWPQAEHLKAALIMDDDASALEAANTLRAYLIVPIAGAWFDKLSADGIYKIEASPASSLYHIVCAIKELIGKHPVL